MNPTDASAMIWMVLLLTGCQKWPDDGVTEVRALLARGVQGLDCFDSAWMRERGGGRASGWRDSNACTFDQNKIQFTVWNGKVNGTARCQVGDVTGEFSVTVYRDAKAANYWGGYFCSQARGRELSSLPLGSVTEKEGALY